MIKPKFFSLWTENVAVEWQAEGRRRLNVVIAAFNAWMREAISHDTYGIDKARDCMALIEEGLQTWAVVDGGEEWLKLLVEMQREIAKRNPAAVNVELYDEKGKPE